MESRRKNCVHSTQQCLRESVARNQEGNSIEPKRVIAPHFDITCNTYTEAVDPAIDTVRVLLRLLFFIGPADKKVYIDRILP
jgi:hypothetical protein